MIPHIGRGIVLALLLAPLASLAQTHTQYLYWIRYQARVPLTAQLSYGGEVEIRRFFDPDVQNQLIHG